MLRLDQRSDTGVWLRSQLRLVWQLASTPQNIEGSLSLPEIRTKGMPDTVFQIVWVVEVVVKPAKTILPSSWPCRNDGASRDLAPLRVDRKCRVWFTGFK